MADTTGKSKTDAKLRVTMPDGSKWDVPVQLIVDSRDAHYAEDGEDTIRYIREGGLSAYDITDWASNNMNWSDVQAHAVMWSSPKPADFQDGWVNGETEIVGEI